MRSMGTESGLVSAEIRRQRRAEQYRELCDRVGADNSVAVSVSRPDDGWPASGLMDMVSPRTTSPKEESMNRVPTKVGTIGVLHGGACVPSVGMHPTAWGLLAGGCP